MKKSFAFIVLTILLFNIGCSNSDDSMNSSPSNNNRTFSFDGTAPVAVDTVQGQFIKEYQVSSTIAGSFAATNYTTGQTLLLFLYDDDENSFPFTNDGEFPINTDPIRATARYWKSNVLDIEANSGFVIVSEYSRIDETNKTFVEISGTFDFTDGTDRVFGTFDNIRVQCLECD